MDLFLLYNNLWLWSSFLFCLIQWVRWKDSQNCYILYRNKVDTKGAFIYAIVFALMMGFRPVDWADSAVYTTHYNILLRTGVTNELIFDTDTEWLWEYIEGLFAAFRLSVSWFYLFVTCCYIGFIVWANKRLIPNNQWIALLFAVSSFSFLTYSYNGIRNGMACSLVLFAFSYLLTYKKTNFYLGLVLLMLAAGIHRSVFLPACCVIASYFLPKRLDWSLWVYLFAIIASLLFGPSIQGFFVSLGFDDRMAHYAGTLVSENKSTSTFFSSLGFRWDFLLYSVMPIVLAWYVIIKRNVTDKTYNILINTYILANAFWILVIQASFSNRFAYLSWFMNPLVFAYPLLKTYIRPDQDRFTVNILMLFVLFTVFMELIYW